MGNMESLEQSQGAGHGEEGKQTVLYISAAESPVNPRAWETRAPSPPLCSQSRLNYTVSSRHLASDLCGSLADRAPCATTVK